jgi:hypothetical protein|nr:MAG TPA: hypothetical protein [Caudoviricetes sp.]
MKIDFTKLSVETSYDKFENIDVTKNLANLIHRCTTDYGLDDWGRELYYSDGEIEVPEKYIPAVLQFVDGSTFLACVKVAIKKVLTDKK